MTSPSRAGDTLRILIVEDHPIVAEGIRALIADEPGYEVVGIAGSVESALRMTAELRPSLALVDFGLPDGTAVDFLARLRTAALDIPVLVLTAEAGDAPLLDAARAGAAGYLLKADTATSMLHAIRTVAGGGSAMPGAALARALEAERRRMAEDRRRDNVRESLTPRELEILRLLATGLDNRAIAEQLTIAYTTVRTHVQSIILKLDARSRLEAVAKAAALGLVERDKPAR